MTECLLGHKMKAPSGVASKPKRAFPPAVGCRVTRWAPVRGGPPGTGLASAALGVQGTPADEVYHPPRPAGAAARAKGPWKVRAPVLGSFSLWLTLVAGFSSDCCRGAGLLPGANRKP